jgi:putative zinc finger protein
MGTRQVLQAPGLTLDTGRTEYFGEKPLAGCDVPDGGVSVGGSSVSHPQVADLIGLYAIGRLPADEQAVVERHLGECRSCAAEYADLSVARSYLAMLTESDVADLLAEADSLRPRPPSTDPER